jgi:hypothetical protein
MIRFLIISAVLLLSLGCFRNNREVDFDYIKVIYSGYGNSGYAYFEPAKDSLIYQMTYAEDTHAHQTLEGRIANSKFLDTFIHAIRTLKQYKDGSISIPISDESFYCGPSIYTEFKDEKGIHFYTYIVGINDTLDQFFHFYENLQNLPWEKRRVKNELVNLPSEKKSANSKMLPTFEKGTFYTALPCGNGIDATKLYGSWRSVSDSLFRTKDGYVKLTIQKNGVCIFKRMFNDSAQYSHVGNVSLNRKNNSLVFTEYGRDYRYTITQLCDNCLQYRSEDELKIIRFDRLHETKEVSPK